MTYSTKQALVEHVERAVADGSYRRQKAMQRLAGPLREQHRACDPRHRVEDAIRATLEWARDNPTDEMIWRGQEQIEDRIDKPVYPEDPTIIEITPATRECFRAMLSALIQELDKGDGG